MATSEADVLASVRVLGEVTIEFDGVDVPPPASLRAVALLGWLAVHAGPRPRSEIASSLWPDVPDVSARQSVRTALWSLRHAFGPHADDVLDTTRKRIGLRNVSIDLHRFHEHVAGGRFEDALALASGELLAGLDDEWALLAREAFRQRMIALLRQRSDEAAADRDFAVAIAHAQRAADLDPLSETCARLLMRRYDEIGDPSVALAVYKHIVDRLRRELQIGPSRETSSLAEQIRARHHVLAAAVAS